MKINCPFLEKQRYPQANNTSVCGVGLNFYAVGQDRALCQTCPIATLGRLPNCQHLDAYAWLEGGPGGARSVDVELFCGLTDDPLPSLRNCARCPERLPRPTAFTVMAMVPAMTG